MQPTWNDTLRASIEAEFAKPRHAAKWEGVVRVGTPTVCNPTKRIARSA